MPFLNAAPFIGEAIESVRAQTLREWELLLVDDGSTDDRSRIAAGYAAREPDRIRVLCHPDRQNRGIAASRNLGVEAARAPLIALLDADDVYEPRRLELHANRLEEDAGLGVVISRELYWRTWAPRAERGPDPDDRVVGPAVEPGRRYEAPGFIVAQLLTAGAPLPPTCSVTFRREAFRRLGGIPEAFRGHYEDQVLFCKLLLESPAFVLGDVLARYRQHEGSVTQGNSPAQSAPGSPATLARARFLRWLVAHLEERRLLLPELRAWVHDQLQRVEQDLALERSAPGAAPGRSLIAGVGAFLPAAAARPLRRARRLFKERRIRREVARRIRQWPMSRSQVALSDVRDYWNARIDDTKLSDHPRGSLGFYEALDAYHLEKCDYLLREVDFAAWSGRDVLEVGCGSGLDLLRFARAGARTTGVDLSPTAIDLAAGYCRAAGVEAQVMEADGACLPFAAASFDLVYCMGVLPFAADPVAIVAEAHRVLRPGGEAIFMVYNRRSWMNLVATLTGRRKGHTDAPGFHLYTHAQFDRLLYTFPERRIVAERFPGPSGHRRALPGVLWRPYGWHLLAFCRKDS